MMRDNCQLPASDHFDDGFVSKGVTGAISMSFADTVLGVFEHYALVISTRAYVLRELLRAKRHGNNITGAMLKQAIKAPRLMEDGALLLRFFESKEPLTLIDVGANEGAWLEKFLGIFPNTFAIAVEPIPSNFERLVARHGNDPRVVTINAAASDAPGTLELFQNENDKAGVGVSAYKYDSRITEYSAATKSHKIQSITLDSLLDEYRGRFQGRVVIKIDVQGHEPSVLRGATALLQKADAAYIEVAFCEFEGQEHGLSEIVPILSKNGLHLGLFQQCIGRTFSRFPVELDIVFVPQKSMPKILGY